MAELGNGTKPLCSMENMDSTVNKTIIQGKKLFSGIWERINYSNDCPY